MRIIIIGGSQGTGALLAQFARDAGHDAVIVTRSGAQLDGIETVQGDATDPVVVREALTRADAVCVTVGGAKGTDRHRTDVTRTVVKVMGDAGVRRLVVVSTLGAGGSAVQLPAHLRLLTKLALTRPLADHNAQEGVVGTSDLDWTIVRPAGLTDAPGTGTWQARTLADPTPLRSSIPRADVARFILEALDDDSTIDQAYGISS